MTARSLETHPIHLGLGATAEPQPEFPRDERAMDWYADYGRRAEADGFEGRLVSSYTFTESWTSWEMHPNGAEVVICTAGRMTLHQEMADGTTASVTIGPGEYAINPPGAWHTADIDGEASALFITSGIGTDHRPR
jgi:mannose-6-phosphate isomerase-like protein (cupin superfamily)